MLKPIVGKGRELQRYSNFDLLRLLLAAEVFVVHACFFADHSFAWHSFIEPVPGFLALSGFLVLKSYSASSGPVEFFGKRALRGLPAMMASLSTGSRTFGAALCL